MITAQDIVRSPAWYPLEAAAGGTCRLLALDEAAYRAASFLDQRLLQRPGGGPAQSSCSGELLTAAAATLVPPAHYLFHIGHVGSTLIARLLGEHPQLFCLREPALLRTFVPTAETADAALAAVVGAASAGPSLETVQRLLGRTWRPEQRALVKTTSFVSELAVRMLTAAEAPSAILVFARPLEYLRGILGGPNSRVEARALASTRMRRLTARLSPGGWRPEVRSEGELIALGWLAEMAALQAAALTRPAQVCWMDFDAFLRAPEHELARLFGALGARIEPQTLHTLVDGPLMTRYAKAPEHAYDAALRRQVHLLAEAEHGEEIRRGLTWLHRAGLADPLARAVLERAARP